MADYGKPYIVVKEGRAEDHRQELIAKGYEELKQKDLAVIREVYDGGHVYYVVTPSDRLLDHTRAFKTPGIKGYAPKGHLKHFAKAEPMDKLPSAEPTEAPIAAPSDKLLQRILNNKYIQKLRLH